MSGLEYSGTDPDKQCMKCDGPVKWFASGFGDRVTELVCESCMTEGQARIQRCFGCSRPVGPPGAGDLLAEYFCPKCIQDEYVLCASIWVDTGKAEPRRMSPTYPGDGLVFSGWRHGDCYVTLNAWAGLLSDEEKERIGEEQLAGRHHGFTTSLGRFVDRAEGEKVAFAAGQIKELSGGLTSERLY